MSLDLFFFFFFFCEVIITIIVVFVSGLCLFKNKNKKASGKTKEAKKGQVEVVG